jgi:hypothetical protein
MPVHAPDRYFLNYQRDGGVEIHFSRDEAAKAAGRPVVVPFEPLDAPDRFRIVASNVRHGGRPTSFVQPPELDHEFIGGMDVDEVCPRTREKALARVAYRNRLGWGRPGTNWFLAVEVGAQVPSYLATVTLLPHDMGTMKPHIFFPIRVVRPTDAELPQYAIG